HGLDIRLQITRFIRAHLSKPSALSLHGIHTMRRWTVSHLTSKKCVRALVTAFTALVCALSVSATTTQSARPAGKGSMWAHDNLVDWMQPAGDPLKRGPDEHAQLLARVGIRRLAFVQAGDGSSEGVDAEIEGMQKHGVTVFAWYTPLNAGDPADRP